MPRAATSSAVPPAALTVSQLSQQLKSHVESAFPSVWVSGEISNFSRPQSGHCYFTLKDDEAQLRAVMWRSTAEKLATPLRDGLEVVCHGGLDVYPPRGAYQLVVRQLQLQGVGALEAALRQLRERLAKEGLFDAARKRPLPPFPRRVAIVTSPTGAALRDFLEVLRRRGRGVETLIFPARVQGEGAAAEIVAAIAAANRAALPIDVLIVARGGGSLEDLWCFNEEAVVRALAASRIPTVSAVGHEIDVTLADLVADLRALTPSEAAERVVPSAAALVDGVAALGRRLTLALESRLVRSRATLDALASRPVFAQPLEGVRLRERRLDEVSGRLHAAVRNELQRRRADAELRAGKLASLSPLAVLERGYTLTLDPATGRPLTSAVGLRKGDRLQTRFAAGSATSVVEETSR